MRRLAVLVALLAAAVLAAWLALRTPQAESVEATGAPASVDDPPAFVDEWLETDDEFETGSADERELVDVEDSDAEPVATALTPRKLRAGERWAHIRVLDGATDRPIEFFGARASSRTSNRQRFEGTLVSRMLLEPHLDGAADVAASPKTVVLQIEARGYMPFEGELLADALNGGVQTVELARGGAVIGRVTIDKKPAKSVRVRMRRTPIDEKDAAGERDPYDLTRFAGRSRLVWTARDGRFAFEDLAFGTYELDVRGREGARACIAVLEVTGTKRLGVGDLALNSGATLRGKALLPPNARAKGVRLLAQANGRTDATELDKHASFEITGLPAGPCSLTVNELESVVIAGPPFQFELAAGETRDVVLDLSDRAGMWIETRVRSAGRPFDAVVHVVGRDATSVIAGPRFQHFDRGTTRWWQAQTQRVTLQITSIEDMPLGIYERDVVPLPSGEGLIELDLELAELSVDWRQITLREFNVVEVLVLKPGTEPLEGVVELEKRGASRESLERAEFALGPIGAGQVEITLRFTSDREPTQIVETNGRTTAHNPPTLGYGGVDESLFTTVFKRTLTARAGEHAVCSFTDADLVR